MNCYDNNGWRSFSWNLAKLANEAKPIVLDPAANKRTNVLTATRRALAVDAVPSVADAVGGGLVTDALINKITKGHMPTSRLGRAALLTSSLFGAGLGSSTGSLGSTWWNYHKELKTEKRRVANALRQQKMHKIGAKNLGAGVTNALIDTAALRVPYIAGLTVAANRFGKDKQMSPQKKYVKGDLYAQLAQLGASAAGTSGALLALRALSKK